jgi:hypothetical protein
VSENLNPFSPRGMRVKTWRGLRPIEEFDDVEIHAMGDGEDGEVWQLTDCPGQAITGYTVFLHCVVGGIETVQDFLFNPTGPGAAESAIQEAGMLGEQLYDMLRAAGMLRLIRSTA